MPDNFLGSIGCRRSLEDSDGYKNGMTTEFRRMELFIRVPAVPGGQIDNGRGVCRELWSEPDGHSPTALCPPWINHKRLGVKVICLWDSFPSFSLHFWPPGFPQSAVAVGATSDLTTIALPLRWHCFFSPLSLIHLVVAHSWFPSVVPSGFSINCNLYGEIHSLFPNSVWKDYCLGSGAVWVATFGVEESVEPLPPYTLHF